MKRWISLALALVVCLSALAVTALAANPFTDVPDSQWYCKDVINAYEMGLINGKTATTFKPDDNLTYAEAVKLAACMNQRYATGSVTLQNGEPWYQTYVDYCKTKKIIGVDYAWEQPATRAGYMEIFAGALPNSALKQINDIPDGTIPDVPMTHNQADSIYKLYRAGILQGNDEAHNCNPAASIKRSEVAAILTRMMDSSKRLSFSMKKTDALKFVTVPQSVEAKEGDHVVLLVEVEGGTAPYTFTWYSVSNGVHEKIAGIPGVELYGDSTSGWVEITVGGPNDWTTNEPFFCVVTDALGKTIASDPVEISVSEPVPPLTIDYHSGDKVLHTYQPIFALTFSGGVGPYVTIWEAEVDGQWVNMKNLRDDVDYYESGWERSCQFQTYVGNDLTLRCVIFDSLGDSVTSEEFHAFLN